MVLSMFTAAHRDLVAAVADMRKRAKMTQRQLAAAVGREQNYIARIETGQRRVDLVEFVILCRACGLDPETETVKLLRQIAAVLPVRRSGRV